MNEGFGGQRRPMFAPPPNRGASRNPLLQSSEAFNELKFRLHQRLIEDLDPTKLDAEQGRARELVEGAARAIIASEMPGVVGFSRDELIAAVCDEILGYERGERGGSRLRELIEEISASAGEIPLREVGRLASQQVERETIDAALHHTNWNRKQAARLLGVSYKTLLQKIRGCGLEP